LPNKTAKNSNVHDFSLREDLGRSHRNDRFMVSCFAEFNQTIGQSEQCEVSAYPNVLTRMVHRSALADDDISGNGGLTTEDFHTKTFAL
jgi:hypothetical protein